MKTTEVLKFLWFYVIVGFVGKIETDSIRIL